MAASIHQVLNSLCDEFSAARLSRQDPVLLLGVLQRLRSFGSGRAAAHPETADPRCCFSVMYA
ncbi:hypothetical protein [Nocardia brasiliensis]|uniref:hypothetical protein n=1 Tax=Nocardia brasiliensis TaxID=37326 RepID=UPI0033CB1F78